jgi:hypothetical protein
MKYHSPKTPQHPGMRSRRQLAASWRNAEINRPISFDFTVKAADTRLYFLSVGFSIRRQGSASGDDLGGSKPDAEPL